jgi:glucose dehydrogenase
MRLWILLGAACATRCRDDHRRSYVPLRRSGAWLMYGKNYSAWRYGDLNQINTGNISKLAPRWMFQPALER